jgi:predicted porin
VEELKTMVRQLQDRLAELEQRQAEAEKIQSAGKRAVESGNDTVRLSISGQVNRGVLAVDDGEETDVHHVDNDASSTRIRFIGEADVSDDLTVGSAIEVQFESNSTADVSQFT